MMRLLFILMILPSAMLAQGTAKSKENLEGCGQIHQVGRYRYENDLEDVVIYRTKRRQIEESAVDHSRLVLKIKWVGENEYWLIFKSARGSAGCLKKGDMMKVKIESCDAKSYKCSYTSSSCGNGKAAFVKLK